ncbi:MAG: hypothetical protein HYY45_13305 [Deltaproteobacteria bacterium]|nr:hypothetical protein [Deltaproteobacteria bacterium]
MIRYHANDWVRPGFYWSPSRWEIVTIPRGGGQLTGEEGVRYLRLPLVLVMILGPMIGALYVVFLPFIGFVLVLSFTAKKCFPVIRKAVVKFLTMMATAPDEKG